MDENTEENIGGIIEVKLYRDGNIGFRIEGDAIRSFHVFGAIGELTEIARRMFVAETTQPSSNDKGLVVARGMPNRRRTN